MTPVAFDPAGSRNNELRSGIIDAVGKFIGRKTAEDHRMDRANARTGEHGNDRLRHHGHVDDDPVTLLNPLPRKHAGKSGHLIKQLAVGERLDDSRHRTVIDERRLFARPLSTWRSSAL